MKLEPQRKINKGCGEYTVCEHSKKKHLIRLHCNSHAYYMLSASLLIQNVCYFSISTLLPWGHLTFKNESRGPSLLCFVITCNLTAINDLSEINDLQNIAKKQKPTKMILKIHWRTKKVMHWYISGHITIARLCSFLLSVSVINKLYFFIYIYIYIYISL